MRPVLFVLSLCFLALLVCAGSAEFVCERGKVNRDVALIKLAETLNPFVSDYAYEAYRLTGDILALRRAIRLEPTRPAYHMYYGLALLKTRPRTRASDREAVTEICKAARLKPYSRRYQAACADYKKVIPIPVVF